MDDLTEIVASAAFAFVVGYLLWPPRYVYWTAAADVVGPVTLLAIFGICLGIGLAVRRFTAVAPRNFAAGGVVAYLIGMSLVETTMTPDSPAHLFLYGFVVVCMIVGAAAGPLYDLATAALERAADYSEG